MTMVSYPANYQDVVLNRLFPPEHLGFYIDVGANDPVFGSVTKHFYDRGWRGVNIEPGGVFLRLAEQRPEDVNLNLAVSDRAGAMTFYEVDPYSGWSTCSRRQAERFRDENGCKLVQRTVPARTLADICEAHVRGPIDFLNIDVEGHERNVLLGGDWRRWRPRVVMIEAVKPNSSIAAHEQWESILLDADYLFGLFDGVNRFYIRAEDSQDLELLQAPANVLDDFISLNEYRLKEEVDALRQRLELLERRCRRHIHLPRISLRLGRRLQTIAGYLPRLPSAGKKWARKAA